MSAHLVGFIFEDMTGTQRTITVERAVYQFPESLQKDVAWFMTEAAEAARVAADEFDRKINPVRRELDPDLDPAGGKRTGHNHFTRDVKAPGKCPACDEYHRRMT